MKAEAQVLKGHLDTLLLASLENGPLHGYAVKEALRNGSGRRRRAYQLTPAGRRRLAGDRAAWRDFASAVTAILEPAR